MENAFVLIPTRAKPVMNVLKVFMALLMKTKTQCAFWIYQSALLKYVTTMAPVNNFNTHPKCMILSVNVMTSMKGYIVKSAKIQPWAIPIAIYLCLLMEKN